MSEEIKDCAFQYATEDGHILEDTALITMKQAEGLWDKYVQKFIRDIESGRNPEMAIWINMTNDSDYHTTSSHWCGQDFEVRDGRLYSLVPVATYE